MFLVSHNRVNFVYALYIYAINENGVPLDNLGSV